MSTIKEQKENLNILVSKITTNQTIDDQKSRRKLNEILSINEKIKS